MVKSKLIALLKTFSKTEWREFLDFVASPFFNKNEAIIRLAHYLKQQAPELPDKKIAKEAVYKAVFGSVAFEEKTYHYCSSFLLKLAEAYIGWKEYRQHGVLPDYHILQGFVKRDLDKHYRYTMHQAETTLQQQPLRNADFHYQQYLLADVANRHFVMQRQRKVDQQLQIAADHFDIYYFSQKLKYLCEMLDRQKAVSAKYTLALLQEVQTHAASAQYAQLPSIQIYHQVLLTLTQADAVTHFLHLKQLTTQYAPLFTDDENKQLYSYMLNFTIQKIREGEDHYVNECLQLYQQGLENQMLYDNGNLSPWTYKNMVKLALRLEQYEWAEAFIMTYNSHLKEEFRQNALEFNLADLYYYKKDFDKALLHLNRTEFTDVFYILSSKTMLAKIFYETDAIEALQSLIASFKIYLKRNPLVSQNAQAPYLNFLNVLNLLVKKDRRLREKVTHDIAHIKLLAERSWLQSMLEKQEK